MAVRHRHLFVGIYWSKFPDILYTTLEIMQQKLFSYILHNKCAIKVWILNAWEFALTVFHWMSCGKYLLRIVTTGEKVVLLVFLVEKNDTA